MAERFNDGGRNITLPRISDNGGRLTDPSQFRSDRSVPPPHQGPRPSPRGQPVQNQQQSGGGLRRLVPSGQQPLTEASRPAAEREGKPAPRRQQLHREDCVSPTFGSSASGAPHGLGCNSFGNRPSFQYDSGSQAFQFVGENLGGREVHDVLEAIHRLCLHLVYVGTGEENPPRVLETCTDPNAGPRHIDDVPAEADAVLVLCYAEQRQYMVEVTRQILRRLKQVSGSTSVLALILRHGNLDSALVRSVSTRLCKDGADHVMVQPRDKMDLQEMIATTLGAQRVRSENERQLQEQIDVRSNSLFFEAAHQIIHGFPKLDLKLQEILPTRNCRGGVGQHVFTCEIGNGKFGRVYLSSPFNKPNGSSLEAVKVISKRTIKTLRHCSQIFKECQLMHRAKHPNIAEFCKLMHAQWNIYIFMEFVGNTDLYAFIRMSPNNRLESEHVLELFLQICEAVAHCHNLLIAHRDIKSENVVVTEEGVPKLVDFGLAIQLNDTDPPKLCEDKCGTIPFAPPEVCRGKHYEARAMDVWSLGILTLEMRCGNNSVCRMLELGKETEPTVELAEVIERFFGCPDWPLACIERNHGVGMADELLAVLRGCLVVTPELRWSATDLWDHIANSEFAERITGRRSERFTARSQAATADYDARPTDIVRPTNDGMGEC